MQIARGDFAGIDSAPSMPTRCGILFNYRVAARSDELLRLLAGSERTPSACVGTEGRDEWMIVRSW